MLMLRLVLARGRRAPLRGQGSGSRRLPLARPVAEVQRLGPRQLRQRLAPNALPRSRPPRTVGCGVGLALGALL